MKKISIMIGGILAFVGFLLYVSYLSKISDKPVVVAVFPVTVDAFTQFQASAREVLSVEGVEVKYFSAEGDASRFQTILDSAIRRHPDVLILVGTQLTNVGLGSRYINFDKPIIASCISDPSKVDALLDVNIDPPRKREVAILTDMPKTDAYKQSVLTIQTAMPKLSRIGILYNNSEINSYNTANQLKQPLEGAGIEVIDGVVSSEDDVIRVASSLIRAGAEMLVIPHDKYVIKQAAALSKMGLEAKPPVPVFALDDGTVRKDGAAFGVSVDYGFLGRITAETALKILSGDSNASKMEVIQQEQAALVINRDVWNELGLPDLQSAAIQQLQPEVFN